jgi:O-antigen/teichoic acid export membrane protein
MAIISCGLGLLLITMAAGEAAYNRRKNQKRVYLSFKMIITAGGFFILGLMLLITTAITTMYSEKKVDEKKPCIIYCD